MSQRKVILFIAASIDGYIAGPGDDLGFLSIVENDGQDYGYTAFIETVDTVILGRRTYDKVLSFGIPFPHADKETYVVTRSPRASEGKVNFFTGNLDSLVKELKAGPGKNIFVDGGAQVVHEMLRLDILDEMVISTIPVLVGDGIRLFQDNRAQQSWRLLHSQGFPSGLVQNHYERVREG
jgi:dihydrofolate reductase